ncbi:DUF6069 family protein [Kutzneria sp. NPDC052558]|uniref:DUF6069 family protein n=1 Tax=Kutzneria sp. NPDC052558 TaxID=3364121 RepID=UPI0037C8F111
MSTQAHPHADASTARVLLGIAIAAVVAVALNAVVAFGATALNPNGTHMGLVVIAYAPLTVAGVLAGVLGWAAVRRYAANARAVLRVLVPAVVVLSFIPDFGLLISGMADVVNLVGLLVMHVVVAVVTVTAVSRLLPLTGYRRTV